MEPTPRSTARRSAPPENATAPAKPIEGSKGRKVFDWLPHALALHVTLPLLMVLGWDVYPALIGGSWLALHLLFPLVLVATYPWWRGQGDALFALILINHAVSFVAFVAFAQLFGI